MAHDDNIFVIPTRSKSKIPQTHPYPLGAKAISDALIDVPQRELLCIEFRFPRRWGKDSGTLVPYQVLRVSYSGPTHFFSASKSMAEKGRYDAKWAIQVYGVPRPLKHVLQGKLIAEALPKIRDWLISNVHSLDREGSHALTFSFDELKNEIVSGETTSSEFATERG
jgi:hypothetical protein